MFLKMFASQNFKFFYRNFNFCSIWRSAFPSTVRKFCVGAKDQSPSFNGLFNVLTSEATVLFCSSKSQCGFVEMCTIIFKKIRQLERHALKMGVQEIKSPFRACVEAIF